MANVPTPILPPVSGGVISAEAWGVPVTNAVNGIVSGNEMLGCILLQEAGTQVINSSAYAQIIWSPAEKIYENPSGLIFNDAYDCLFVPTGMNGLWKIDWSFTFQNTEADRAFRVGCNVAGVVKQQHQGRAPYGASFTAHGTMTTRLADAATISWYAQVGGTTAGCTLITKYVYFERVGNWAPTRMDDDTGLWQGEAPAVPLPPPADEMDAMAA